MSIHAKALKIMSFAAGLSLASCGTATPEPASGPTMTDLPSLSVAIELEAAARGRAMAVMACASCHAIGVEGSSTFAPAPPFRDIVHRRSLDDLETAFATGLVTTHPAMPPYVFRASEIDDLIAYLETLRTARAGAL